jgi:phage-related protein
MFKVVFYKSVNGIEFVRDFLKNELSDDDRKTVGDALQTVQYGFPNVTMPLVSHVVDDIHEVRVHISDKRIVRILFCHVDGFLVLLHGFVKKNQETPLQDLRLAKSRRKNL